LTQSFVVLMIGNSRVKSLRRKGTFNAYNIVVAGGKERPTKLLLCVCVSISIHIYMYTYVCIYIYNV